MSLIKPKIVSKLPGPKSEKYLKKLKKLNLGYNDPYPFVHSGEGEECYFKDIDNNTFLDFGTQIASNPLGYNHPKLREIIKEHSKFQPVKYAGQDFTVKEHVEMLEELISITPKELDSAFLVNSGAEAVENCLKLALRKQKNAKYGISFSSAFHGRTLGALSCTNSKTVQKKNFLSIPMKRLEFSENSLEELDRILKQESSCQEIGFIILEPIQGEGGYRISPKRLIKGIRDFTKKHNIPFIADEVQSGVGRTGKWWAIDHYNVKPDLLSSAKALNVGACIANKKLAPEKGSISSTWGGGNVIDLAIGIETIKIIKRKKLLAKNEKNGKYLMKKLGELDSNKVSDIRGRGLMVAFDLNSKNERNTFIINCLESGLLLIGCGENGVRVIPPYIVSKEDINVGISIMEESLSKIKKKIKPAGKICDYLPCAETHI